MTGLDWLRQTVASWYGLEVISYTQVRDAWSLETPQGSKCFKRVDSTPEKVKFVSAALDHVLNKGFRHTVPFIRTLTDKPFIVIPEGLFYLTDWIPGREGDMTNLEDLIAAAKVMARFNRASAGFKPPENSINRASWGNLPITWQNRQKQLESYIGLAKALQDKFSRLYLGSCEWYLQRSSLALSILSASNYDALVAAAKQAGSLIHRDYTYHNFIVGDKLYIIDFDYCTQDIRAYDLGRFIRKTAKHHAWNLNPVRHLLNAYNEEVPLARDELVFILAYLYFPQRVWRIANRFYEGKKAKTEDLYDQLRTEILNYNLESTFLWQFSFEVSKGGLVKG